MPPPKAPPADWPGIRGATLPPMPPPKAPPDGPVANGLPPEVVGFRGPSGVRLPPTAPPANPGAPGMDPVGNRGLFWKPPLPGAKGLDVAGGAMPPRPPVMGPSPADGTLPPVPPPDGPVANGLPKPGRKLALQVGSAVDVRVCEAGTHSGVVAHCGSPSALVPEQLARSDE